MISPVVFAMAYAADWLVGDPVWLAHPVRWMGLMIRDGETLLRKFVRTSRGEFIAGGLLSLIVIGGFGVSSWLLLRWLASRNQALSFAVSMYLAMTTLATRSLLTETRAVRHLHLHEDLFSARQQLGRIVGRDTKDLNEPEVARAAIETVAESASDGIVAPMFYLAIGGVPAALSYKAINTLDSMIGHRGSPYEFFGKCAARLDDVANFIPARLTALLFVLASGILGLEAHEAWRVMRRDASRHKSPNSGHPEAAMAGALGVRLGGLNLYDGEACYSQTLGEARNDLDSRALKNALRLTACVSLLMFVLCIAALFLAVRR